MRRKNKIGALCCLMLVLGSVSTWAQWSYGVRVGANFSTYKSKPLDPKFTVGPHLGGFVTYAVNSVFGIQGELLYSMQGCRYEVSASALNPDETVTFRRRTHNLNLPVLARFQFGRNFHFLLGPQFGVLLGAQEKGVEGGYVRMSATRPFDFGLLGGLGYAFNEHLEVDIRYVHGFLPVFDYYGDDYKILNRNLQLSLGYRF